MGRFWGVLRSPWSAVMAWGLVVVLLVALLAIWIDYGSANVGLATEVAALEEELSESERLREEYFDDATSLRSQLGDLELELDNLRADYLRNLEELQEQVKEQEPEPEEEAPPPQPAQPSGTIPSDGIWQAGPGGDFPPGTYRAPGGGQCYWARLRSPNPNDIIVNGLGQNPTVEIAPHDWFETRSCGEWTQLG